MHAMCSRLLLPAFGTCYTRTSCFLCRNIEEKKKGTNFFLVSCQFVENETCKLTNQTVASGGLSPATDQIKIWSRNLGGIHVSPGKFSDFSLAEEKLCCEHWNVSIKEYFLSAWSIIWCMRQRVTPLPSMGLEWHILCVQQDLHTTALPTAWTLQLLYNKGKLFL